MSEVFPEKTPDDGVQVSVAGLDMTCQLPRSAIPVRALVVVECLVPEGEQGTSSMLWWSASDGTTSWVLEGMTRFVQHGIRQDWDDSMLGSGDEEEP